MLDRMLEAGVDPAGFGTVDAGEPVLRVWDALDGTTIRARRFVVATGSRPFVPDIRGLDALPYLTNETIFGVAELPERLIVLGGGYIG